MSEGRLFSLPIRRVIARRGCSCSCSCWMGLRPTLLCVQRVAPQTALAAEASAADWMRSVCAPGVYATLMTTGRRTMVHKLSARCAKLARAHELLRASERPPSETAAFGQALAGSLRLALQNDSSVRFLPGDELHITLQVSPEVAALQIYVQPCPPAPRRHLEAALSRPRERAAASVREDVLRGATGGWATPMVHPSLEPVEGLEVEDTLLHEAGTDRVLEGLNSNLFVVRSDGSLRTAATSEGAYPGSVRDVVLDPKLWGHASDAVQRHWLQALLVTCVTCVTCITCVTCVSRVTCVTCVTLTAGPPQAALRKLERRVERLLPHAVGCPRLHVRDAPVGQPRAVGRPPARDAPRASGLAFGSHLRRLDAGAADG